MYKSYMDWDLKTSFAIKSHFTYETLWMKTEIQRLGFFNERIYLGRDSVISISYLRSINQRTDCMKLQVQNG